MRSPFLFLALLVVLLPSVALGQKSYTLDEDPIRNGKRAIEAGNFKAAKAALREAVENEYHLDEAMLLLARVEVFEGRYQEAEPLYRQALGYRGDKGKAFPEAHAGLGLLLLRLGREAEASLEFKQALEEQAGLWDAEYGRARILLESKNWEEARKLLEGGKDRKGLLEGEDKYHYGMALYSLGKNQIENAEREALLALTLNPSDADYGTLVGRIYELRNAPTLAIDAYEKVLNTPGVTRTAPMMHTLGLLYEKLGRHNDALDRYQESVKIDSTYAPALKDLGDLYFRAKRYDRAARVYLRYALLEKDDVESLVRLSEACTNIGHYGQAVEAAKTALELDSSRSDAKLALARAGIHDRDAKVRAEAAQMYAALSGSEAITAEDHVLLGAYYIQTKDYVRARQNLNRALELNPERADACFQKGVLDLSMGRPADAASHLEKAIRLDPENPLSHLNLGIARIQMQEVLRAIAPLRRALALKSDISVARILLAQALAASDSVNAARTEYETILEAEPGNAKAWRGLGFCHIRGEAYGEAVKAYKKATGAEPGNAEGWAGLGNAYLGLKDWAAAEAAFEKARSIDPANPTMVKGFELLQELRSQGKGNP